MPASGITRKGHQDILSYEDFMLIAGAAVSLGVEKIRITGGEPLLRKGILNFLCDLKKLPGLNYLAVTTNGHSLLRDAARLRDIGVTSLNVSMDSLVPETFHSITGYGRLTQVLDGIHYADMLGVPIKLNVVVMKGINDHEIPDFAALACRYGWNVRFIEFMPSYVCHPGLKGVCAEQIYNRITSRYRLEKLSRDQVSGPSQDYRIIDGKGRIGIISAMSCPFCHACNRLRITSVGGLKSCLFSDSEMDLKPHLRTKNFIGLRNLMRMGAMQKPQRHHVHWNDDINPSLQMACVGG
jgi:cyclic pyranopterin phosphate synthase